MKLFVKFFVPFFFLRGRKMSGFAGVTTIPVVVPACVKPGESFYTRLETNGAVVYVWVCGVWWACVWCTWVFMCSIYWVTIQRWNTDRDGRQTISSPLLFLYLHVVIFADFASHLPSKRRSRLHSLPQPWGNALIIMMSSIFVHWIFLS